MLFLFDYNTIIYYIYNITKLFKLINVNKNIKEVEEPKTKYFLNNLQ